MSDNADQSWAEGMAAVGAVFHASEHPVHAYLQTIAGFMKGKGNDRKYACVPDFLEREGRDYEASPQMPPGEKRCRKSQCYMNAYRLAEAHPELDYVEGVAISGNLIPMDHAWCADREGRVVDPTWPDGHHYVGVPLRMGFVRRTVFAKKTYGVVDNWQQHWPLLRGLPKSEWHEDRYQFYCIHAASMQEAGGAEPVRAALGQGLAMEGEGT